jgi:hypothetical protein
MFLSLNVLMQTFLTALVYSVIAEPSRVAVPAPGAVLSSMLTIEGLMLAALSVTAALSGETEWGRRLATKPATVGWAVTVAIGLVAIGAVTSWHEVYVAPAGSPNIVQATALLVGIATPPFFALWITLGLRTGKV